MAGSSHSNGNRIECVLDADWWEDKTVLKVAAETGLRDTKAIYHVPFGALRDRQNGKPNGRRRALKCLPGFGQIWRMIVLGLQFLTAAGIVMTLCTEG